MSLLGDNVASPSDVRVQMDAVGKRYWKLEERAMLLRSLLPFARPARSELWALHDLDLTIRRGETVGVIGRNGAGKTTLLRLLAGVTRPTTGRVLVAGRVAPLISLGVGFHKEMSGRENVLVNGMLLGLTESQVRERFDEIVAFAELADFVDTPVKFYSSGMFMRLGFSVAIHTEPDVLLVDEVLAVGDLAFQLKCFEKMRQLQHAGTTVVLVSHSMTAIRMLCPRAVVLRHGRMAFDGDVADAIACHHELLSIDGAGTSPVSDPDAGPQVVGGVTTLERQLVGPDGPVRHADPDTPLRACLRVRFDRDVDSPQVFFHVTGEDGRLVYGHHTPVGERHRSFASGDEADVALAFTPRLGGGTYRVTTTITSADGRQVLAMDPDGILFYVPPRLGSEGVADLDGVVLLDDRPLADRRSFVLGEGAGNLPRALGADGERW